MPKTGNILSIDFDFFQKVNEETIQSCYPDGIDLPMDITKLIWIAHYGNPRSRKKLIQVIPDKDNINMLRDIIRNNKPYDSMIRNSHVHCYDFILDYLSEHPEITHLHLYNIDMHHDLHNYNPELDCGNWIGMLKEQIQSDNKKFRLTWIANKTSKTAYGLSDEFDNFIKETLDCLTGKQFDLVFLCRSDPWTPPHLDNTFIQLANYICKHAVSCDIEDDVMESRYDLEFKRATKQIDQYYNQQNLRKHA